MTRSKCAVSKTNPRMVILAAWVGLLSSFYCLGARAQGNPAQLVQQAMNELAMGRVDAAVAALEQAENTLRQMNLRGPGAAQVYVARGVVEIRGRQDHAAGLEYFKQGLCQDLASRANPMFESPDVTSLHKIAASFAMTPGACAALNAPPVPLTGMPPGGGQYPAGGYPTAPVCVPGDPSCDTSCKQAFDFCETTADCCIGTTCVDFVCTPGDDPRSANLGKGGGSVDAGDWVPHARIVLNFGTGIGFGSGEKTGDGNVERPPNQISPGQMSYGGGAFWNKLHFRLNAMFNLMESRRLSIGATFRGDLTLDPSEIQPKFGPSVLANVSYRLMGKEFTGFHLNFLGGLGGGVFYHRLTYPDCAEDVYNESDNHPLYPDGKTGDYTLCQAENIEPNADGEMVWNADGAVDRTYFRKSGMVIVELGVDGYYWVNNHFGINFGIVTDTMFPTFALNIDIQAGAAVRF